jgi:hypothetical protein
MLEAEVGFAGHEVGPRACPKADQGVSHFLILRESGELEIGLLCTGGLGNCIIRIHV